MIRAGSRVLLLVHALVLNAPDVIAATNLVTNPGFENGVTGWTEIGDCTLSTSDRSRSGESCGFVTDRTSRWHGVRQSMLGIMRKNATYSISGWVRLEDADSDVVELTVMLEDARGVQYSHPARSTAYDDRWTLLSGSFTLDVAGDLKVLDVYFEGPAAGVAFYLDDVSASEVNWKTRANERIEQIRKRDALIVVLSAAGQPVPGAEVSIGQKRHLFGFGASIDSNVFDNPEYADFFKHHFEWAVPDSDCKWYVNEPEAGDVDYRTADALYEFCKTNDIKVRGHSVFWAGKAFVPDWVRELSKDELEAAVRRRIRSIVTHFKGKFAHWEVNNEMLGGSFYADHLGEIDGVPVRVWMFQEAHSIDPGCTLCINDYGPIAVGVRVKEFKDHVNGLIEGGAPVHVIGLQCHSHGGFNRGLFLSRFEEMARMGIPIWVTEFDVEQEDEHKRADDFEDFYRIAFSQPSVKGILMYGFWEDAHWRPNGHIVNSDWELNEAGRRYEALMDEWTTNTRVTADERGIAAFRGFHGKYEISVKSEGDRDTSTTITLPPGGGMARFVVQLD